MRKRKRQSPAAASGGARLGGSVNPSKPRRKKRFVRDRPSIGRPSATRCRNVEKRPRRRRESTKCDAERRAGGLALFSTFAYERAKPFLPVELPLSGMFLSPVCSVCNNEVSDGRIVAGNPRWRRRREMTFRQTGFPDRPWKRGIHKATCCKNDRMERTDARRQTSISATTTPAPAIRTRTTGTGRRHRRVNCHGRWLRGSNL